MEKYKRYYGIFGFIAALVALALILYFIINPKVTTLKTANEDFLNKTNLLSQKQQLKDNVKRKIKKLNDSIINSQKIRIFKKFM